MQKHPKFDKLDGDNKEVWLRITRKRPYGSRVASVNMDHMGKLNQSWHGRNRKLIKDDFTEPYSFLLVLEAHA